MYFFVSCLLGSCEVDWTDRNLENLGRVQEPCVKGRAHLTTLDSRLQQATWLKKGYV
jgi:hypothetical protein